MGIFFICSQFNLGADYKYFKIPMTNEIFSIKVEKDIHMTELNCNVSRREIHQVRRARCASNLTICK